MHHSIIRWWLFGRLNANMLYKRQGCVYSSARCGGVAEWLKATVLKTVDGKPFESSNLSSSAISNPGLMKRLGFFVCIFLEMLLSWFKVGTINAITTGWQ